MNFVSYVMGAMTVVLAYSLFTNPEEEELELVKEEAEPSITFNDYTGRYVTLSCQTCRKLKKHKEIQLDLYQCTKCKRHTDLRHH